MLHARGFHAVLAVAMLACIIAFAGGCRSSSGSKDPSPEVLQPASPPAPEAVPAPQPPPPRPAGGQIADEDRLRKLVQGKTTKAEVRDLFGIPQEIVVSPGVESFLYYRDQASGFFTRTTERVEMLTIRFDSQGVLKDFEYRYSGK
jgi:outer membrane protein assembly factor BamE (lipoprotein component of BamABCDE complex)